MSQFVSVLGVVPAILPVLQPASMPCSSSGSPSDASDILLSAASYISSEWYSIINAAFSRDKETRSSNKDVSEAPADGSEARPGLKVTEAERAKADVLEGISRLLFGSSADYARAAFEKALIMRDRRSFKIRLMFCRFRDSIADSRVKDAFDSGMKDAITHAEEIAGCRPDPSPRRLSNAERRRKELREERIRRAGVQMDMFDDMPSGGWFVDIRTPEQHEGEKPSNIIRKARAYSCVADITKDIEEGRITPYGTIEEVVADMKAGLISPSYASLFLAEIDKRNMSAYRKISTISGKVNNIIDEEPVDDDISDGCCEDEKPGSYEERVESISPTGYDFDSDKNWE